MGIDSKLMWWVQMWVPGQLEAQGNLLPIFRVVYVTHVVWMYVGSDVRSGAARGPAQIVAAGQLVAYLSCLLSFVFVHFAGDVGGGGTYSGFRYPFFNGN